jgi:methyl coenzyme M reductase subunit C-like uncharacterized protein (methanogenesis marker protein 7)
MPSRLSRTRGQVARSADPAQERAQHLVRPAGLARLVRLEHVARQRIQRLAQMFEDIGHAVDHRFEQQDRDPSRCSASLLPVICCDQVDNEENSVKRIVSSLSRISTKPTGETKKSSCTRRTRGVER